MKNNSVAYLETSKTQNHNYTDHNSVRRLNASELANRQLRSGNKHLESAMTVSEGKKRPSNRNMNELAQRYLTDYHNEAPVVREHHNLLEGGSFFGDIWDGIKDVANTAAPFAGVIAKAIG